MAIKIDDYSFGCMKIKGQIYDRDLIVFPDRIISGWWRSEGHSLSVSDLSDVIDYGPELLIIGKGAYGVMDIPDNTLKILKANNIEVISSNTKDAVDIFNEKCNTVKKAVGAFHLTC